MKSIEMRTTLRELCAKFLAESVADGEIKEFPVSIPSSLGNQIFHYFKDYEPNFWVNQLNAARILNVNGISHKSPYFDHFHERLYYAQNLESLEIKEMKSWEHRYVETYSNGRFIPTGMDQYEETPAWEAYYATEDEEEQDMPDRIDLCRMLMCLLNPTSISQLKELYIEKHSKLMFYTGSILQMASLLGSHLESLSLVYCGIGQRDFIAICDNFPQLTKLDLTGGVFNNVQGIGKLINLKELILNDVKFETKEQIEDIFELQNLKTLRLADSRSGKNFQCYMECDKSLETLKFLDVAFCEITLGQLVKFIDSHKKLKAVNVIGSNIKKSMIKREGRYIECLNASSIMACLHVIEYTLNFEISAHSLEYCYVLLSKFLTIKENDNVSEDVIIKCVDLLDRVTRLPKRYTDFMEVLKVATEGKRVTLLTHLQIRSLVGLCIHSALKYLKELNTIGIQETCFQILLNPHLIKETAGIRIEIILEISEYLRRNREINSPVRVCIEYLTKTVPTLSEHALVYFARRELTGRVLFLLKRSYFGGKMPDPNDAIQIIRLLRMFYENRTYYSPYLVYNDQSIVSALCAVLNKHDEEVQIQMLMLELIYIVISEGHPRSMIVLFGKDNFIDLTRALYSKCRQKVRGAALILIHMYTTLNPRTKEEEKEKKEESKENQKEPEEEEHEDTMKIRMSEDFINALSTYEHTPEMGCLNGFAWAINRCRCWEVEHLCWWYYTLYMSWKHDPAEVRQFVETFFDRVEAASESEDLVEEGSE